MFLFVLQSFIYLQFAKCLRYALNMGRGLLTSSQKSKKVSHSKINTEVKLFFLTIKMAVGNVGAFALSFEGVQKTDRWHVIVSAQPVVGYVGFYTDHSQ